MPKKKYTFTLDELPLMRDEFLKQFFKAVCLECNVKQPKLNQIYSNLVETWEKENG